MKFNKLALVSLLSVTAAFSVNNAHATIATYTDKTTFLSLLKPGYFQDDFNGVANGDIQGTVTRSGGLFSVNYDTQPPNGVYSITEALSTFDTGDKLVATMGGSNIYAVGGYFYLVDFLGDFLGDFNPFAGKNISAVASNDIDPIAPLSAVNAVTNFFGWISSTPFKTVTVSGGGGAPNRWVALDNFIVGAPVPEPGTLALLALGGVAMVRRRQKLA